MTVAQGVSMIAALVLLAAAAPMEESVVRVQVYLAGWDWTTPWRVGRVQGGLGSGFVIEGGKVLTNAHVVRDARQVLVKRHHVAEPFVARVEAVGHDCDLALLSVEDPAFHRGLRALPLGALPAARSRVVTYGYPLGGDDVSSTDGIVSRVEWGSYAHTGSDRHLVVQTDAAINPGNSGGPAVQRGKVVGVAFQAARAMENVGFFIPAPVVRHFLGDVADGAYHGFPDGGFAYAQLLSPAYRRERGLPEGRGGVVVEQVLPGGTAEGVLRAGDVITAADGAAVASDGTVALGDARVSFLHLLDMKQVGEPVRLGVWRDGRELEQVATSRRIARWDRHRSGYDVQPRYLVYAGLVFMAAPTSRPSGARSEGAPEKARNSS